MILIRFKEVILIWYSFGNKTATEPLKFYTIIGRSIGYDACNYVLKKVGFDNSNMD